MFFLKKAIFSNSLMPVTRYNLRKTKRTDLEKKLESIDFESKITHFGHNKIFP